MVVALWSVEAVLDLVALLQPPRANPANIMVNKIDDFIGRIGFDPTDHAHPARFAIDLPADQGRRVPLPRDGINVPCVSKCHGSILLACNDEPLSSLRCAL